MYCWGRNAEYQLGLSDAVDRGVPSQVHFRGMFSTVTRPPSGATGWIAAGGNTTCAVADPDPGYPALARHVFCWGSDVPVGMGLAAGNPLTPTSVLDEATLSGRTIANVALGAAHGCVLEASAPPASTSQLYCWGDDSSEQVGAPPDALCMNAPCVTRPTPALSPGTEIDGRPALGGAHSCALTAAGSTILCWGASSSAQAGTLSASVGVQALGGSTNTFVALAAGASFTCTISGRALKCWGDNHYGQVEGATMMCSALACPFVSGASTLRTTAHLLALGANHGCVVEYGTPQTIACWGANLFGQSGRQGPSASEVASLTEVDVPGVMASDVNVLAAGDGHTCALTASQGIWCWGDNRQGQLGVRDDLYLGTAPSFTLTGPPRGDAGM
jgi:alpha-tubulin suppressor-like RCC1 family protein